MTNTNEEVKLENCPCCKGLATYSEERILSNLYVYMVFCNECTVRIDGTNKEKVITRWNTRTNTAREQELEKVNKALIEKLNAICKENKISDIGIYKPESLLSAEQAELIEDYVKNKYTIIP